MLSASASAGSARSISSHLGPRGPQSCNSFNRRSSRRHRHGRGDGGDDHRSYRRRRHRRVRDGSRCIDRRGRLATTSSTRAAAAARQGEGGGGGGEGEGGGGGKGEGGGGGGWVGSGRLRTSSKTLPPSHVALDGSVGRCETASRSRRLAGRQQSALDLRRDERHRVIREGETQRVSSSHKALQSAFDLCVFTWSWSTWSAVGNLTSRAGELRSAPSGPDDRDRATG